MSTRAGVGLIAGVAAACAQPRATPSHALAPASPGCGQPLAAGTTWQRLQVRGVERRYRLRVPAGYEPRRAYPLVIAWHGAWSAADHAQRGFGLDAAVGAEALVAYPAGLARSNDPEDTGWDLAPDGADVAMADALIGAVAARACVDDTRVFGFGASLGGYLAAAVACAGRLRGVAVIEGGPPRGRCARPVTAVIVHGVHDEVVALSEGAAGWARWSALAGCGAVAAPAPGHPACVARDRCARPVWWCTHRQTDEHGHAMPPWAAQVAWDAFRAAP